MDRFKRIAQIAEQMAALERELKRLVNSSDSARGTEPPAVVSAAVQHVGPETRNGSLAAKILDFVDREPRRKFNAKKITVGLGLPAEKERAVRLTLSRLFRTRKIARPDRGLYRSKPGGAEAN